MVAPLPALDRRTGSGLAALDRLSSLPSRGYDPRSALSNDRNLRSFADAMGAGRALQTQGGGRQLQSFGQQAGRQLSTQASQLGRRLNDPYGGQNQPGLNALMGGTGNKALDFGNAAGLTNAGGAWAALDAHNNEIAQAAARYGVPPNLLKSMINRESSGNWDANNFVQTGYRNQRMLPFVGIFESSAQAWGINFDQMIGNKQAQIDGMARILSGLAQQYGSYENAAYVYFGGEAALHGGFTDELGMNSATYGQKAIDGWRQLDAMGGGGGSFGNSWQSKGWDGNSVGGSLLSFAQQYVGTPYVLGSVPGRGVQPNSWDCSGLTYWMNQNYGNGSLPQGSHEQYAYAAQTGQLFTDSSQLQPGDILFFNTGFSYRGNAASHTGIYLGNGQMLHASSPQAGTIISDIRDPYYSNIFMGGMHGAVTGVSGAGSGSATSGSGYGSGRQYSGYAAPFSRTVSKFTRFL